MKLSTQIKLVWAFHNVVAHPASEICRWVGLGFCALNMPLFGQIADQVGSALHDSTCPDVAKLAALEAKEKIDALKR